MASSALIFAHADGDGHLAAEQTRRNLAEDGIDVLRIVVDPLKTRNWKFWFDHFQEADFGNAEHVYLVDLMLGGPDPEQAYRALLERVRREPDRQFHFVDHHPLKGALDVPANLELRFVSSVFECCFGRPSELMLIASICDRDEAPVASMLSSCHRRRALGINRAVTERTVLAGSALLHLLHHEHWEVFEQLADEPAEYHRTFYGNRVSKQPKSPLLQLAYAVQKAG